MERTIEKIPIWALCYIINGDTDGLTDEDVAMVDEFFECYRKAGMDVQIVSSITDEAEEEPHTYFTHFPAFGLATDVVDCEVLYTLRK